MSKNIITGYAALWGVKYDMGGYQEVIQRGALDGVDFLQCRLLYNHDQNLLLASAKSGTLTVRADSKGLFYRAELPDTPTGKEVAELLARGDLSHSSWGFTIASGGKQWSNDGTVLTITKVGRLLDVAPVVYPANTETTSMLEVPMFSDSVSKSSDYGQMQEDFEWAKERVSFSNMAAKIQSDNYKREAFAPIRAQMDRDLSEAAQRLGVPLSSL